MTPLKYFASKHHCSALHTNAQTKSMHNDTHIKMVSVSLLALSYTTNLCMMMYRQLQRAEALAATSLHFSFSLFTNQLEYKYMYVAADEIDQYTSVYCIASMCQWVTIRTLIISAGVIHIQQQLQKLFLYFLFSHWFKGAQFKYVIGDVLGCQPTINQI